MSSDRMAETVLHHYKLTRFSNLNLLLIDLPRFYTITNLQGSQTKDVEDDRKKSFTPLQTYKVLKHNKAICYLSLSFTPLQTYKVLKPMH